MTLEKHKGNITILLYYRGGLSLYEIELHEIELHGVIGLGHDLLSRCICMHMYID